MFVLLFIVYCACFGCSRVLDYGVFACFLAQSYILFIYDARDARENFVLKAKIISRVGVL